MLLDIQRLPRQAFLVMEEVLHVKNAASVHGTQQQVVVVAFADAITLTSQDPLHYRWS